MNNANVLAHGNQNATPQTIFTTRAGPRHRDPLDYEHPYDSMRRYAELLALKHDCARTRHSYYRAMRVLHEYFRADPATLGEDEFRDYILYVKTASTGSTGTFGRRWKKWACTSNPSQTGNGTPRANPCPLENGTRPAPEHPIPDIMLYFKRFRNKRLIPKSRIKPRSSVPKNLQKPCTDKKRPMPNPTLRVKTPYRRLWKPNCEATFQAQAACPPLPGVPFQT